MNLCALRGAVYGRFKTQKDFAEAIEWGTGKVNRILKGEYVPDVVEAARMTIVLKLDVADYSKIFLSSQSPNGE